jgi:hypothetical protein
MHVENLSSVNGIRFIFSTALWFEQNHVVYFKYKPKQQTLEI